MRAGQRKFPKHQMLTGDHNALLLPPPPLLQHGFCHQAAVLTCRRRGSGSGMSWCGAEQAGWLFLGVGVEVGGMCASPSACALWGPVRFTAGLCYPTETLSPGTQHTNRIRVSGFETGQHQGGVGRRAAGGFGGGGEPG